MFNIMDIRNYDEYIYYHSVNVGVLSIMVGARYGLERNKLYDLGIAAILHDLGKKFLPEEIANGKWPLTGKEREAWKSHPKLGAEYLKTSYHFPAMVYSGILMHHEWFNGEGYPLEKAEETYRYMRGSLKLQTAMMQ